MEMSDEASTTGGPETPTRSGPQTPGHPSFRRQRASRACETCHSRKVRCDAASLGVPCTNCVAFSIECKIPAPKRKKAHGKAKDSDSENEVPVEDSPRVENGTPTQSSRVAPDAEDGMPATALSEEQVSEQSKKSGNWAQFMKPKFARAPIKEAGRVAYLGESSNLSLLVHDRHGTTDVVHYPLPDTSRGSGTRPVEMDDTELEILHQRGAFLLPPRALCDELVAAYFRWIAPVVPVVSRSRFMRRYRDPKNPPSLLLLQAILLAGSRVCTNPQLMDPNGSTTPAAMTFYKRAKALYDANYEEDRVTIVQALVLMGWYWEGPEGNYLYVTKNVFYWSRVAIIVAQGFGMHRSVESSQLSRPDKRLWKRIWWTLFTRDRSVAVALGRPVHINTDDTDIEMISEDDFIEDEGDRPGELPEETHVQFFLHYVRLCEIMGLVLSQQYSVASKAGRQNAINLAHSDMALADWLRNCPAEVKWEKDRHRFWSALLLSNYYTTLCLLHRAHMPPATGRLNEPTNGASDDAAYPSRNIAFQAAGMITQIVEALQAHDELRFTPAFIVYSLFSALIMHVYQMRSSIPSIVTASQERLHICMGALKEVSKVWLVAKTVHTLFLSILGNKHFEERLQKAAGRRHKKPRIDSQPPQQQAAHESPPKSRFDDLSLGYPTALGAPQVSFERSRPQTPAPNASRDTTHSVPSITGPVHPASATLGPSANATLSPTLRQTDAFMGTTASRTQTREPTPFGNAGQPSYSIPATPPDLYLVTRNSPTISQSLWENFQPDQLFPESSYVNFLGAAGGSGNLDPALQNPAAGSSAGGGGLRTPSVIPTTLGSNAPSSMGPARILGGGLAVNETAWAAQPSPDDSWSNSSRGGPAVPTTLNVEDWYQFFGVNGGDINQATADVGM